MVAGKNCERFTLQCEKLLVKFNDRTARLKKISEKGESFKEKNFFAVYTVTIKQSTASRSADHAIRLVYPSSPHIQLSRTRLPGAFRGLDVSLRENNVVFSYRLFFIDLLR